MTLVFKERFFWDLLLDFSTHPWPKQPFFYPFIYPFQVKPRLANLTLNTSSGEHPFD